MTDTMPVGALINLSDTDLTVADPTEDARGKQVLDAAGEQIGTVDDILIDDQETRVRFLRVGHGGFLGIGKSHFLVPVDAVTRVDDEHVHINRARSDLSNVPVYDPELAYDIGYYGDVYGWWGYPPYWGAGYTYPGYPRY